MINPAAILAAGLRTASHAPSPVSLGWPRGLAGRVRVSAHPDEWLIDIASGWAIIGVGIQTVAVRIRVFEHVWKVLQAKTEVYPMLQVELSNRLISALNLLEPDVAPRQQVARLAEQELRRRLARYQLSDRLFREKYGMTLEEFEAAEIVRQRGYSFEVENDHQDWDQAVDGIRTIERQLTALRGDR